MYTIIWNIKAKNIKKIGVFNVQIFIQKLKVLGVLEEGT